MRRSACASSTRAQRVILSYPPYFRSFFQGNQHHLAPEAVSWFDPAVTWLPRRFYARKEQGTSKLNYQNGQSTLIDRRTASIISQLRISIPTWTTWLFSSPDHQARTYLSQTMYRKNREEPECRGKVSETVTFKLGLKSPQASATIPSDCPSIRISFSQYTR